MDGAFQKCDGRAYPFTSDKTSRVDSVDAASNGTRMVVYSRSQRLHLAMLLSFALAACGSDAAAPPVKSVSSKPAPVRSKGKLAMVVPPPVTHAQSLPGLEGVIGASRADLIRRFGSPRLDVWEGDARKLQFAGSACVLDAFLYPSAAGREPQVTYIEARRASDGRDVDRAGCISALGAKI